MLTSSNPAVKSLHPTREDIELRAYQIYIERGCADGHDVDDWLQAEHELSEKYANIGRWRRRREVKSLTIPRRAIHPS